MGEAPFKACRCCQYSCAGGDLALEREQGKGGPGARSLAESLCSGILSSAFVCTQRTSQNWFLVTVHLSANAGCGQMRNMWSKINFCSKFLRLKINYC